MANAMIAYTWEPLDDLDDGQEPDPIDGEAFTVTAGLVWWSAPAAGTDDE